MNIDLNEDTVKNPEQVAILEKYLKTLVDFEIEKEPLATYRPGDRQFCRSFGVLGHDGGKW